MFCAAGAMRRPRISERAIRRSARSDRSEEHTSELQSQSNLVCRLLLEKKNAHSLRSGQALNEANRTPALPALNVAIIGQPNVGKSTLVYRLLAHVRSIVTPSPGTTRDP